MSAKWLLCAAVLLVACGDDDVRPLRREPQNESTTDASTPAGDNDGLPGQSEVHWQAPLSYGPSLQASPNAARPALEPFLCRMFS